MENSISGAADRTWQHDAVMAFINGYLWPRQVTCDRVTYANTPYGPIVAAFSWLNLGEYENVDRYVNYH